MPAKKYLRKIMFNRRNCDRKSQLSGILTEPFNAPAVSVFNIKYFSSQEECESINMAEVDKSDQNKHVKDQCLEMEEKRHIQCSGYFQVIEL